MAARHDPPAEVRFWTKVDRNGPVPADRPELGPCWIWLGTTVGRGYGHFRYGGRMVMAHRWAWEEANGPIPADLQPDHLCRTPACVRPAHLEIVTGRENTLRGVSFAATNVRVSRCPSGHPYDHANTRAYQGRRYCRACNNNGGQGRDVQAYRKQAGF